MDFLYRRPRRERGQLVKYPYFTDNAQERGMTCASSKPKELMDKGALPIPPHVFAELISFPKSQHLKRQLPSEGEFIGLAHLLSSKKKQQEACLRGSVV